MTPEDKQQRLGELRDEIARLEAELSADRPAVWQPKPNEFYGMYHATAGIVLGMVGAIASLLFNVLGSLAVGQHPLRLIQVYLTFPLGERALAPEFSTGIALAIGCCLYIGTGMVLGVLFQMAIAKFIPNANLVNRLLFATLLGLVLWGVNFYLILDWLQPLLFGGNWIVDPTVLPPWVGAATHLVFAWTMALLYPWGKQDQYRRPSGAYSPATTGT